MSSRRLRIFFSGIGGSGVSAIAMFMADRGHMVAGSDRSFDRNPNHPVYRILRSRGIVVAPQDGSGIDESFDFVVFSTAVEPDRPEFAKARALGIPIKTRPEYLAEIVRDFKTIAVAGTSGKSTTSGMLAFLMVRLGLRPNFIGGGRVKQLRRQTSTGNSITGDSCLLVVEACESDGTIVDYQPLHSMILNLDLDHHSLEETGGMFRTLMNKTSGKVILNADDPHLMRFTPKTAVTFSLSAPAEYRATDISLKPMASVFSVQGMRFRLSLPGRYNLSNALSCIALLSELGTPLGDIAGPLHEFTGIERRFDVVHDDGERLVIDDYAHNPHKISSLMEAMQAIRERICYIFQPHGFGPTRMMKKEYIETFAKHLRDSDHLVLLPIFYAGGTAARDISSRDLADAIREDGKSVEACEREEVLSRLQEWENYVVFGARDETLSDFARDIARGLVHPYRLPVDNQEEEW